MTTSRRSHVPFSGIITGCVRCTSAIRRHRHRRHMIAHTDDCLLLPCGCAAAPARTSASAGTASAGAFSSAPLPERRAGSAGSSWSVPPSAGAGAGSGARWMPIGSACASAKACRSARVAGGSAGALCADAAALSRCLICAARPPRANSPSNGVPPTWCTHTAHTQRGRGSGPRERERERRGGLAKRVDAGMGDAARAQHRAGGRARVPAPVAWRVALAAHAASASAAVRAQHAPEAGGSSPNSESPRAGRSAPPSHRAAAGVGQADRPPPSQAAGRATGTSGTAGTWPSRRTSRTRTACRHTR